MTRFSFSAAFVALGLTAGTAPVGAQTLYKCVGPDNRISYQQRPCAGAGTTVDVKPLPEQPAGTGPASAAIPAKTATRTTPMSAQEAGNNDQLASLPASPPAKANGRLDGWPKVGDGLEIGMSPGQVIKSWGRPHSIDLSSGDGMWFDYCDLRIAFFWKGKLASWSALFDDSKAGTRMFRYGEPWIAASQKWGYQRERENFSNETGRGDVQRWANGSWIVTDAQGNIVSWCRSSPASSVAPPIVRTRWE